MKNPTEFPESTKVIGKTIENFVCNYLQRAGLVLLTANYLCKCGEIDLIMRDGEVLVFVEVRYRKISDYGDAVSTVNKVKQKKIIKTATTYLLENKLFDKVSCRFDVVAVSGDSEKDLLWIKDAFWVKW